jgi:glucose-6-phosphate dehydrogenase assembly protein OpcA
LLLAGWLASRLQWRRRSGFERSGAGVRLELRRGESKVVLEIHTAAVPEVSEPRIDALHLASGGEPPARFSVVRSSGGAHLVTRVELGGAELCGTIARLEGAEEGRLVSREMEIVEHDRVYEAALGFFATRRPAQVPETPS